jgi:predicted acetyltransferase
MTDPHDGMVSFQQALRAGMIELARVPDYQDLFIHFDVPTPGVHRLTYVRLSKDRRTVKAFLACIMNGEIDGFPCVSVGYAVPVSERNKGRAKQILRDAINDQIRQATDNDIEAIYIEAVIDVTNITSQRVAEAVMGVRHESITDSVSGRPAVRYTARFSGIP